MVAHISQQDLPMTDFLENVVTQLLAGLPVSAHSVQVNVVIKNLASVTGGKVLGYPVFFVVPTPGHEAGNVYLNWSEGVYEGAMNREDSGDNLLETL